MTMLRSLFDARTYGAVGDGVTDDTNALQSAVNQAAAAGGGIVWLPIGTFYITDTITISTEGVSIEGVGRGAVIIRNRSTKHAFTLSAARTGVRGVRVSCESVGLGAVHVNGVAQFQLEDIEVLNGADEGIRVSGTIDGIGSVIRDVKIPSCAVGVELASTVTNLTLTNVDTAGSTLELSLSTGVGNALEGRAGALLYRQIQLNHSQIGALRATPQTVVPAPGAGLAIMPVSIHLVFDVTTTAYSESADNIALEYSGGTDCLVVETTGFLDQTSDQVRFQSMAEAVFTPVANEALQLFNNGDGEFGSGNAANTLSVRVYYFIVPTVAFKGD